MQENSPDKIFRLFVMARLFSFYYSFVFDL